jgi:hypothetical protein
MHFQGMLLVEFTPKQYAEARARVRRYNRAIARAIQTKDEKALVGAIQDLESWSDGIAENRSSPRSWGIRLALFLADRFLLGGDRAGARIAVHGRLVAKDVDDAGEVLRGHVRSFFTLTLKGREVELAKINLWIPDSLVAAELGPSTGPLRVMRHEFLLILTA